MKTNLILLFCRHVPAYLSLITSKPTSSNFCIRRPRRRSGRLYLPKIGSAWRRRFTKRRNRWLKSTRRARWNSSMN